MRGYSKLTIEIDDFSLDRLKEMAEEDGYSDVDAYATELFNNAMYEQDSTDLIVSIPNTLIELLDRDVKTDCYESRSDLITFILRMYYSDIGRLLK